MYKIDYQLRLNWNETWCMDHPHYHENVEILLSLSDGGEFFIADKLYQIQSGSLFILKDATLHKSILMEKYKRYVLHISPENLRLISTDKTDFIGYLEKSAICTLLPPETVEKLVYQLYRLEQPVEGEFGSDLRKCWQLTEFLITVFTAAGSTDTYAKVVNITFNKIEPIIKYIQENLSEPLTLDELSARFFISKYYLCHIFKIATGFSVTEYIISCRILEAKKLLRNGCRVQDAGEAVGFRSNSHFIRTFGALTGIPPKKYAKGFRHGQHVPYGLGQG